MPVKVTGIALMPLRETWKKQTPHWFREARIPMPSEWRFMKEWKTHKRTFLERGFSIRQENGGWRIQQWLLKDATGYTLTPIGAEKLANMGKAQGLLELPPEPKIELDLPELPSRYNDILFDYQREPARQLLRALLHGRNEWGYSGCLDGSQMGTGKTYVGLAAALSLSHLLAKGLPVGVICKRTNIPDWEAAFEVFGATPKFVRNYESLRGGRNEHVKMRIISDGRKKFKRFEWDTAPGEMVFIFDEVHSCKNRWSLQTGLLNGAIRTKCPVIGLSGTVAENPMHLAAVGKVLGLHRGGESFERFLEAHGCLKQGDSWYFPTGSKRGLVFMKTLHRKIYPKRGARVRKSDLGDRFPDKQIMKKLVTSPAIAKVAADYDKADAEIEKMKDLGMSGFLIEGKKRSLYIKVRMASEEAKIDSIVELAKEALEEGYSVPIFVNFDKVRQEIMQRLKTDCGIFGGQSMEQRKACLAEFQSNRSRVIVANIAAGGTGTNLHDTEGGHPRYSIICPNDNPIEIRQVIDRTHRAGGRTKAMIVILCAAKTIEERIYLNIERKGSSIDALNDG